jgi:hypothetical protein
MDCYNNLSPSRGALYAIGNIKILPSFLEAALRPASSQGDSSVHLPTTVAHCYPATLYSTRSGISHVTPYAKSSASRSA